MMNARTTGRPRRRAAAPRRCQLCLPSSASRHWLRWLPWKMCTEVRGQLRSPMMDSQKRCHRLLYLFPVLTSEAPFNSVGPCCLLNYCMNPKCSGDQQLEAGGRHLYNRGEAPPIHWGKGRTSCKAWSHHLQRESRGVCDAVRRFTFDCTAPQSPQIWPILMGYLGFNS